MWDASGSTLWVLATLYDEIQSPLTNAARISAEIRQHEDRHGLSPKAMLSLRWRLVELEPDDPEPSPPHPRSRRLRLQVA